MNGGAVGTRINWSAPVRVYGRSGVTVFVPTWVSGFLYVLALLACGLFFVGQVLNSATLNGVSIGVASTGFAAWLGLLLLARHHVARVLAGRSSVLNYDENDRDES